MKNYSEPTRNLLGIQRLFLINGEEVLLTFDNIAINGDIISLDYRGMQTAKFKISSMLSGCDIEYIENFKPTMQGRHSKQDEQTEADGLREAISNLLAEIRGLKTERNKLLFKEVRGEFNINDEVLVRLTHKGFLHWQAAYNRFLPEEHPLDHFTGRRDDDGWVTFQLWKFMEIFGETISLGVSPLFETVIRFK